MLSKVPLLIKNLHLNYRSLFVLVSWCWEIRVKLVICLQHQSCQLFLNREQNTLDFLSLLQKWKQPLQSLEARLLKEKQLIRWVRWTPNWDNLQKMLMNMPRRTTVMVERRICHQVTSRVTSSDLSKVLQILWPGTYPSLQSGLPSPFLTREMHSPLLHLHISLPPSCTTNHDQSTAS